MKMTRRGWIGIAVVLTVLAVIGHQQEELEKQQKGHSQAKDEKPLPPLPDMPTENQAEKAKDRFCELMHGYKKAPFNRSLLMVAQSLRDKDRQSFYVIIENEKDVVSIMGIITVGKIIRDEYPTVINELVVVWNISQDKLTALKGEGLYKFVSDEIFEGDNFGDKVLAQMFLNCIPYQKIANMPADVQAWLTKEKEGQK
jgi:hypothetical protein